MPWRVPADVQYRVGEMRSGQPTGCWSPWVDRFRRDTGDIDNKGMSTLADELACVDSLLDRVTVVTRISLPAEAPDQESVCSSG